MRGCGIMNIIEKIAFLNSKLQSVSQSTAVYASYLDKLEGIIFLFIMYIHVYTTSR